MSAFVVDVTANERFCGATWSAVTVDHCVWAGNGA